MFSTITKNTVIAGVLFIILSVPLICLANQKTLGSNYRLQNSGLIFSTVYERNEHYDVMIFTPSVPRIRVINNYAVIFDNVFDITDPAKPILITKYKTETVENENSDDNYLFFDSESGKLILYDFYGLPQIVRKKQFDIDVNGDFYILGNYLFLSKNHDIDMYNISNKYSPTFVAKYADEDIWFSSLNGEGDYLYASFRQSEFVRSSGFIILKINQSNDLIFQTQVLDNANDLTTGSFIVKEDYLYISSSNNGVKIFDLRDKSNVSKIGAYLGINSVPFNIVYNNYAFYRWSEGAGYITINPNPTKIHSNTFIRIDEEGGIGPRTGITDLSIVNSNYLYLTSVTGESFQKSGPYWFEHKLTVYDIDGLDGNGTSTTIKNIVSKVKKRKISLFWQTDIENEVKIFFLIKKIKKKKDSVSAQNAGKTFRTLKRTKINPKGNPSEGALYRFNDRKVKKGKVYKYIIKFKDFDGEVHTLKKKEVSFN